MCHSCDNPSCVNPKHLWLGMTADNNRDAAEKGRKAEGEMISAKLTEGNIHEIRILYVAGVVNRQIADMFGVSEVCVGRIIQRKTWGHI